MRASDLFASPHRKSTVLPFVPGPRRLLAEFSTKALTDDAEQTSWTSLRIWQLASGKLLCEKQRGPEPLTIERETVESVAQARAFFGGGWVVRELFAELDSARFPRW